MRQADPQPMCERYCDAGRATDMTDWIPEDDRFLTLYVEIELAEEVERELLAPLRSHNIPAEIPPQGSGIPMSEYIGYIGTVTQTAAASMFIYQQIRAWLRKRQLEGRPTRVRTKRKGREELDLNRATDDELHALILEAEARKQTRPSLVERARGVWLKATQGGNRDQNR
jgi:hypothetical protein